MPCACTRIGTVQSMIALLRSPRARLGALAVVLIGTSIAVVAIAGPSQADVERAVRSTGFAGPIIYVLLYVLLTVALFPGAVITAAGGAVFGVALGTLLTVLGATIGATIAFRVGRRLGRTEVERIAGTRLGALDGWVTRHGFVAVLYARLIPVLPFNALNYAAGVTGVGRREYVLATLIGIVPGTFAYTALGSSLSHPASPVFIGSVALIVLLAAAGPLINRRLHRQSTAAANIEPVPPEGPPRRTSG